MALKKLPETERNTSLELYECKGCKQRRYAVYVVFPFSDTGEVIYNHSEVTSRCLYCGATTYDVQEYALLAGYKLADRRYYGRRH